MNRIATIFLSGIALSIACAACTVLTPTTPAPKPIPSGQLTVDWPDLGSGEARYITINLGPDSLEQCRRTSPKFPFDSAVTRIQDRIELAALARCLNHPDMASRSILLVGRADATGTEPYNEALGKKRAMQIKDLLVSGGLDESRIKVASVGDKGAVGYLPEYSNGYDRRVDVVVLGGVHTP